MTFHWPHLFWLLLVPLALAILELRRRRAQSIDTRHPKIARAEAGVHHFKIRTSNDPSGGAAPCTPRTRWRLYLGLGLLVVALARPQWGHLDEPVFDQAREIVIAVDLSRSMLATDVRPSRLERSKLLVTSLLERLAGERVGLVVFAGTAFLQSPLSGDYEILNEFLPSLSPDYLPQGGSNYRALIETSLSAFSASGSADRFLIVLSDGEATDDEWKNAAQELKTKGIRVIGLGIGTAEGSILPEADGTFVKDERGAVVLSKLEPATLQELSSLTSGVYVDASSWVDLAQLLQTTVEKGRKGEFREQRRARAIERFQWALAPALLFLLWSLYREFPVHARPGLVHARREGLAPSAPASQQPPPLPRASSSAVSVLLIAAAVSGLVPRSTAAETSIAEPLSKLVGQFAARDTLTARDYAELARSTLTYGERSKSTQQQPNEGAIRDGIAAVEAGQALDPKAADWKKLRADLEKLLEKPEPPPEQKPQDQQEQQKDQNEDQEQKDQEQQQQQNSEQKESEKNSGQQNQPQKQNQEQQKDAGEKPSEKDQKQENESNSSQNPDRPEQNQKNPSKQDPAFGDMSKEPPKTPPPPPQNSASPETQKVGGTPEEKGATPPADPALVVPLQRLEQVRNQDSPVRLQQLMRGEQEKPAPSGKNW